MPRIRDILKKAEREGRGAGSAAAEWYYDRSEPSREGYMWVLKGIEDGDPEVLDTFMSASLSGEFAGDMTPQRLWEELDMNERQIEDYGDEVCDLWEKGFSSAYEDTVVTMTKERLERQVTFIIDVTVDVQNLAKLLSDMEEVVAKANASLDDSKVMDYCGERIVD